MSAPLSVFRSPRGRDEFIAAYQAVLKQWPVSFTQRYVHTRLGHTHVLIAGPEDAPAVVLLHPAGTSSAVWVRNVEALTRRHRVYAVDILGQPGLGTLERPFHRRQRADFAGWMSDLLDGLGLDRVDLVGNSFGGFVALSTASLLPSRVRAVVLISPAATIAPMRAWSRHFIPANIAGEVLGSSRLRKRPFKWIWQEFPIDPALQRLRMATATAGRPRHGMPTVLSDDELKRIRAPVLLLIGDHEVIYPPERAFERARRLLPNVQTRLVPNANHLAQYTAPEAVNALITRFLD